MIENGICNMECYDEACGYDTPDCPHPDTLCSFACFDEMINNGVCDVERCYNPDCNWDMPDCPDPLT